MTRYNDPVEEGWYGDFDEQMHDQLVTGYREGVDRVMTFLDAETGYQVRCLIEEGEI